MVLQSHDVFSRFALRASTRDQYIIFEEPNFQPLPKYTPTQRQETFRKTRNPPLAAPSFFFNPIILTKSEFQEDVTSRLSSPGVISQIDVSRIPGKRHRAIPASDPLVPINDPEFISRRTMAVQIARGPMERAIYAREGKSESTGPWPS